MIREGGLPVTGVFERTRLRVNDMTKGAEVPWHASKIPASLVFFERAAEAPLPAISTEQTAAIRARPIRDLDAQEAYSSRWSATRWKDTPTFSPLIPPIPWPGA